MIRITERDGRRAVSARELHQFLENKREFATWMKQRIEQYGFVENQDFTSFDNIVKRENGATVRKEYALTIDMAKELSMVENNERGRLARKYFIECEKTAKEKQAFCLPQTFAEALRLAADQQEQIEAQAKQIGEQQEAIRQSAQEVAALNGKVAEMKPKVSYYEKILASEATLTVTQIAQDYGMSAMAFNTALKEIGVQRKVNGQWVLYARHSKRGYVHSRSIDIVRHDGRHETKTCTEWTQEGRKFLYDTLKGCGILPLIERG